jgi:ParB/RepB/Spo0J family partition protein
MKKDLKVAMQQNLDRELRSGSARPHRLDAVVGGAAFAPRDITKPLDDLARKIMLDHIDPDPNQPRKSRDPENLKDLALSIKENGVLQPITVSRAGDTDRYCVIAGHRRVEAARLAKVSEIPAIIRPDNYDERRRLQEQLVENLQRENLPPIDEARGIQLLIESQQLTQRDVAKKLGKPLTYINELLAILRIQPKQLARAQHLPKRALIEIARAKTDTEQQQLVDKALTTDTPWQDVKRARTSTATPKTSLGDARAYTTRYEEDGALVQVTFKGETKPVPTKRVMATLRKLVHRLATAEKKRAEKGS